MKHLRLFIAENTETLPDTVEAMTRLGVTVVGTSTSSFQMLSLAQQLRPDLVLLDLGIRAPGDPIEAAILLHESFGIPLVFTAAAGTEIPIARTDCAEPFAYLYRPYTLNQLAAVLSAVAIRIAREKELRREQGYLASTLHSAYDGFWVLDQSGRFVESSDRWCQLTGYTRAELQQMEFGALAADNETYELNAILDDLPRIGSHRFEFRLRTKAKSDESIEVYAICPAAADSRVRCYFRVITTKKNAEDELLRKTALLQAQMTSSTDGILVVNREGERMLQNESFTRLFRIPPSFGERLSNIGELQWAANTVSNGATFYSEACRLNADSEEICSSQLALKDGRIIETICSPILGEDGVWYGRIWIFRDITERDRVERQLRNLSRAVEQSPVSILITDTHGVIEYVNPTFEKVTGYSKHEAIGKNPRILKSGEHNETFYRELWKTIARGAEWRGEFRNRRKNGELYWEQATITGIRDADGRISHYVAVKLDITEKKAAELELMQSRSELVDSNIRLQTALERARELAIEADASNRAKSAFLTSMSHELRTPLNAVIGIASTLDETISKEELAESASLILESGRSLLGIIEEILDYSGLNAGKTRLNTQTFALLPAINHCLRLAIERARGRGLTVTYSLSPALPAEVVGDPRRLKQILLNLLINAVKFTDRGRIHLNITCRSGGKGKWRLSFNVIDSGSGIASKDLEQLFQPFSRLESTSAAPTPGTGLGLAISKSFAKLMGGDIVVKSKSGRGSAFRCSIVADAAESRGSILEQPDTAGLRGRTVALVGPAGSKRRLLRGALACWGLRVTCFDTLDTFAHATRREPMEFAVMHGITPPTGTLVEVLKGCSFVSIVWIQPSASSSELAHGLGRMILGSPVDLAELARTLAAALVKTSAPGLVVNQPSGATKIKLAKRLPLRILAADDISTNREMLRRLTLHMGYELTLVENGAEVLATLNRQQFDLVLLDVQMPVMDGLTAARTIVQTMPQPSERPKLVALTANALPGDRETCLAAGMDDYLSKPVTPKDLEACFLRLFTAKQAPAPQPLPPKASPGRGAPWVDTTHLGALMADIPPTEAKEMLHQLHQNVAEDYNKLRQWVQDACVKREQRVAAELIHGLKGCFANLGWARITHRCAEVIAQARKGEFQDWDKLPGELDELFAASNAAMVGLLESTRGLTSPANAGTPAMPAPSATTDHFVETK